jgi:hypothetical protein
MSDLSRLTPDEVEELAEYAGKLMSDGMGREAADEEALKRIQAERGKKAEREKKRVPHFEKIGGMIIPTISWVIKRMFPPGDLCMIYGDSGLYKSFLSIALGLCVSIGVDFFGMAIRRRGTVYYIASEGTSGIYRRARAWAQENGYDIKDAPFYRYMATANLIEGCGVLMKALEEGVENEKAPPALAVIDTLQRSLGGDDSDTRDSAAGLAAIDRIRTRWPEMAILLVHHVGQADKTRARGAYLWRAALDQEFRIEKANPKDKADKTIVLRHTKAKESEPLPSIAFRLRAVNLFDDNGKPFLNEDGETEGSAVLERIEYEPPGGEATGKNQLKIIEILKREESGSMLLEDLISAFQTQTGKRKSQFNDALGTLCERGVVYQETGFVCLKGRTT